jgi:hypothetical protein
MQVVADEVAPVVRLGDSTVVHSAGVDNHS